MQRVLVISSFVAKGTVGLKATVPPLLKPGRDVISIPTTVLSNHPGYASTGGGPIAASQLSRMLDAHAANGWLTEIDAIFSGYLPAPDHVSFVASTVNRVRALNPDAFYLCDPILGDDPHGLYIPEATAKAIRDELLPLADIATPNRFELSWLSRETVTDSASARTAGRKLRLPRLVLTSVPCRNAELANILIVPSGDWTTSVKLRPRAPHGTGDLFAGLLLSAILDGASDDVALAHATGGVELAMLQPSNSDDLQLSGLIWTGEFVIPSEVSAIA